MADEYFFMLFSFLLIIGMLFSDNPASASNDDPIEPDEILAKYIQACGGTALGNIKTEISKGTLVRGASGATPFEIYANNSGQWRYNQIFAWGDQINYGCDGSNAWAVDNNGSVGIDPRQTFDFSLMMDFQMALKINNLFSEIAVIGADTINEKAAVILLASLPNGTSIELAFDRESGLLMSAGNIWFEDYRDVDGIKRPHKILLGDRETADFVQMVMQISKIEHNLDLEDSLFIKPECTLDKEEPPLFKRWAKAEIDSNTMAACVGVYQLPGDSTAVYSVSTQENHLMIKKSGWQYKIEIIPESELDYFVDFINWEFHFIKDKTGEIVALELKPDRSIRAVKIK